MYLLDQAARNVAIQMHTFKAGDRIWSSRIESFNSLRAAGYGYTIKDKPHISINHILKNFELQQLYQRMRDVIESRRDENFLEVSSDRFIKEIERQAKKI